MKHTHILLMVVMVWTVVVPVQTAKAVPADADNTITLTCRLPRSDTEKKIDLLPGPEWLLEEDAFVLYQEAVKLLPAGMDARIISTWSKMSPGELPDQQVKAVLQQARPSLNKIQEAVRCKQCNWPKGEVEFSLPLTDCRLMGQLLAVKAIYDMKQGQADAALSGIQNGLGMARHLGQGPTLIHGLTGIVLAATMCRPIAYYTEQPGCVSLYTALEALPKPFINLEELFRAEIEEIDMYQDVNAQNKSGLNEQQNNMHQRCKELTMRLYRDFAALQVIEALRLYAAANKGALPQRLEQITQVTVPEDPLHQMAFVYNNANGKATLTSAPPAGEDARKGLSYELTIAAEK